MAEQETAHYETIGRILTEAGFFLLARNERVSVEGKLITTAYENIVSNNTEKDEDVDTDDVTVLANGETLEVSKIDATAGTIELANETTAQTVTVTYYHSPVAVNFVEVVREDVEERIKKKMSALSCWSTTDSTTIATRLRMVTRLWAAGLLQTKDYGYNADSEETSKDGYRKINEARSLLKELYEECAENCGQDDVNGSAADVIGGDGGDLFGKFNRHKPHSEVF